MAWRFKEENYKELHLTMPFVNSLSFGCESSKKNCVGK
jgi:hypothetical protein